NTGGTDHQRPCTETHACIHLPETVEHKRHIGAKVFTIETGSDLQLCDHVVLAYIALACKEADHGIGVHKKAVVYIIIAAEVQGGRKGHKETIVGGDGGKVLDHTPVIALPAFLVLLFQGIRVDIGDAQVKVPVDGRFFVKDAAYICNGGP